MRRQHRTERRVSDTPVRRPRGDRYGDYPWGYEVGPCWENSGMYWLYWPRPVSPYLSAEDELAFLEGEAVSVRQYLEGLDQRMRELRTGEGDEEEYSEDADQRLVALRTGEGEQ